MNTPLPKISIVTVVFNGADFLERTICSVLDQQYPNLEYVIIDGGSSDGSVDIIRKYQDHLHFWMSEPDKGMYDGLQKGFEKTSGDIMGWINADDVLHAGALHRVARIVTRFPEINWLTGVPCAMDEADNIMVPYAHDYPVWSKGRFYAGDYQWIQQESTLWRRSLWVKAGNSLNKDLKLAGDFELWVRFFQHEQLYYVPFLIGAFRHRREGQKSVVHYRKYLEEASQSLKRYRAPWKKIIYVPLNAIDRFLISVPGVKKMYYKTGFRRLLGYAPKIAFNSSVQEFEIL